jgi:hypothetical protein
MSFQYEDYFQILTISAKKPRTKKNPAARYIYISHTESVTKLHVLHLMLELINNLHHQTSYFTIAKDKKDGIKIFLCLDNENHMSS